MNHLPTNPPVSSSYEYIYGFNLLDDLHNFYPELIYDESLFNFMPIAWFQHRTSQLFPAAYTRQLNLYRLYSAQTRRNMFETWHAVRFPTIINQASPAPVPPVAPSHPIEPEPVQMPAPPIVPILNTAPSRRRRQMTTSWFTFDTNPLVIDNTQMDNTARMLVDLLNGAGLQDVVVAPTVEQINAHSSIVDSSDLPAETSCSICQEIHTSQQWRRLQCNHYYHRDCIDRWFLNHVQCPVCRADIRE